MRAFGALPRANQQTVVRALTVGFGIVLVLLVLAGAVALQETEEQQIEHSRELAMESMVIIGISIVVAAVSAWGTIAFVKRCLREIAEQHEELGRVSWHMLQTQEQTARRFSHELHDELGQSLAAIRAQVLRMDRTNDTLVLVDTAIANVRELSQLLRPVILDDFGLQAGLRWLLEGFAERSQMETGVEILLEERLHSDLETHLFRIAQEALTNVARHSSASQVTLRLEAQAERVVMSIRDNGRGLHESAPPPHPSLGLVGMRARARQCGGELELSPMHPTGLCVIARLPLRFARDEVPEDYGSV